MDSRAARLLPLAPALLILIRTLAAPLPLWIGDVPDDALFYPQIARRWIAGEGWSFDGVQPTSGFHPLWMAASALICGLTAPDPRPETQIRLLAAAYGLIGIAAAARWARLLRGRGAAVFAALASVGITGGYGLGMETALLLWLLGGWLGAARPGGAAGWGLAAVLCRVDALLLLIRPGRRGAAGLAGGGIGAGLVLLWNASITGEYASTAAAIKAMGPAAARLGRLQWQTVWSHTPALTLLGAGLLVAGLAHRRAAGGAGTAAGTTDRLLRGAALAAGLQLALQYLLNNLTGPWYHTPLAWALLAAGLSACRGLLAGRFGALLAAGLTGWAILRGAPLPGPGLHAAVWAFAEEAGRAARAGQPEKQVRYAMTEDFPGILSMASGLRVLPADGLAGSVAWRAALETGEALQAGCALGADGWFVSRRREGFGAEAAHADRVQPPFLPVPPSPVPLYRADRLAEAVYGARLFALYRLRCPQGSDRADRSDRPEDPG